LFTDESCRSSAAVVTPAYGIVSNPAVRPNVEATVPCAKSSEVHYFDNVQTPVVAWNLSHPVQATNSNAWHSVETQVKEYSMDVETDCGSTEHSAGDSLNVDTAVSGALCSVEQLTSTRKQLSLNVDDSGIHLDSSLMMSPLPSDTIANTSVTSDTSDKRLHTVELRNYQKELAKSGIHGQNCIICAPTGSGKTFTAGYICSSRRSMALEKKERFKALFIVCIKNLVQQQRDALRQVMPDGQIMGIDEKRLLSQYVSDCDVVVATAQVCTVLHNCVVFVHCIPSGTNRGTVVKHIFSAIG
jgi:DEAD/DEAH box helicase